MSFRNLTARYKRDIGPVPRVGIFGLLGTGSIGNDASMEAVLGYLRTHHPDAIVDAMCSGPARVTAEYGIEATRILWHQKYDQRISGVPALAFKIAGKGIDAFRTAVWVHRHDVVIVPGMGILEATLPLRALGFPYSMLLLSASGRLSGTQVALISVGADVINQRTHRWISDLAARLASYRSYRDVHSREAMRQRGLDVTHDRVYPDLVFSISTPPYEPGDPQTVGVGVMSYHGSNDDRKQAKEIYASYVKNIKLFIRWLVDGNRKVRLFVGDVAVDDAVLNEIVAELREQRPDLEPDSVVIQQTASFAELTRAMAQAGTVVATRYHNVICALKLGIPTISLGYAQKNVELMADVGMSEFCQSAKSLDIDLLIRQFTELESRSTELRQAIMERNLANVRQLEQQFADVSALFSRPENQRRVPSACVECGAND
jgi:polysaccharide pyruvyl transferase WcaK-like protein